MCLYDKKRFRIASKPIKVWKVFLNYNSGLYTPYTYTKIHKIMFGGSYGPKRFYGFKVNYEFGIGFIHAFQTKEMAEKTATRIHNNKGWNTVVIEGYIPRFIRYAVGTDGDICSRILILNL